MKQLIKLTDLQINFIDNFVGFESERKKVVSTTDFYVRPCDIKRIVRFKNSTTVYFYGDDETITVDETPEEIFKQIEECEK